MSRILVMTATALALGPAGAPEKASPLRYLRDAGGKLVLESEVTETATAYVSCTDRGTEKMTLTLRFGKDGKLTGAEALQETPGGKKTAAATFQGNTARLTRAGGAAERFDFKADPVVTTAPDWSDIFQLLRRYDRRRSGRQEFTGFWIHPVQPARVLTFTVERLGEDTIERQGKKETLGRYRVRLRSGDYLVWADAAGRVCKLMPAQRPAAAVVLEGHHEATRALK